MMLGAVTLITLIGLVPPGEDEQAKRDRKTLTEIRAEKWEAVADEMDTMRQDYVDFVAQCHSPGLPMQDVHGHFVGFAPRVRDNPNACEDSEELEESYEAAYKKLLKIDWNRTVMSDYSKRIWDEQEPERKKRKR